MSKPRSSQHVILSARYFVLLSVTTVLLWLLAAWILNARVVRHYREYSYAMRFSCTHCPRSVVWRTGSLRGDRYYAFTYAAELMARNLVMRPRRWQCRYGSADVIDDGDASCWHDMQRSIERTPSLVRAPLPDACVALLNCIAIILVLAIVSTMPIACAGWKLFMAKNKHVLLLERLLICRVNLVLSFSVLIICACLPENIMRSSMNSRNAERDRLRFLLDVGKPVDFKRIELLLALNSPQWPEPRALAMEDMIELHSRQNLAFRLGHSTNQQANILACRYFYGNTNWPFAIDHTVMDRIYADGRLTAPIGNVENFRQLLALLQNEEFNHFEAYQKLNKELASRPIDIVTNSNGRIVVEWSIFRTDFVIKNIGHAISVPLPVRHEQIRRQGRLRNWKRPNVLDNEMAISRVK